MRRQLTIKLKDELLLENQPETTEKDQKQKEKTFGSDLGKIFRYTEMPALMLEKFYLRLYGFIYKAAKESEKKKLEELKNLQSAAVAVTSSQIDEEIMSEITDQVQYIDLLNELFTCYELYDPAVNRYVQINKDNIDDFVDNLVTIQYLRDRAAKEALKNFQ